MTGFYPCCMQCESLDVCQICGFCSNCKSPAECQEENDLKDSEKKDDLK
jgi:hypothetical protein